ncbi:MAG: prepilin-type N-terminal cleavage/methylation domain-containing protein, partial [Planctomycetota bacterium]|nr:prepilin-type N-terminal cleavage/methylation domain-containing protein [Planctomycetota bacterium]
MRPRRHGFTLLELLLVVFILASLAAVTSSMVDDVHDQARFDDTRARLDQIRRAVVGPEAVMAPAAGYVADMGAPPTSLRDLLVNPNAPGGVYEVDLTTGVGSGWRGPYLRGSARAADGALELPDGWGNPDQGAHDPNFGWRFDRFGDDQTPGPPLGQGDVQVTSRGANGVLDYVADAALSVRVARADHHVDVGPWRVELTIDATAPLSPGEGLALRLWCPSPLGLATPAADDDIAPVVGERNDVTLTAGSNVVVLQFANGPRWISHGVR